MFRRRKKHKASGRLPRAFLGVIASLCMTLCISSVVLATINQGDSYTNILSGGSGIRVTGVSVSKSAGDGKKPVFQLVDVTNRDTYDISGMKSQSLWATADTLISIKNGNGTATFTNSFLAYKQAFFKINFQLGMNLSPVLPVTSPFFRDIHGCQIQHFQKAVI